MTSPVLTVRTTLLLAATLLPGCLAVDNDRHIIGTSVPIEAVTPATSPPGALPADGPSLTGVDRGHWLRTEYLVPTDGTYHWPQYTLLPMTLNETERQRGVVPSPMRALDLASSNGGQAGEAIVAPMVAAVDLVAMIPRMFFEHPWVATRSPSQWPYERARTEYPPPDALDAVEP